MILFKLQEQQYIDYHTKNRKIIVYLLEIRRKEKNSFSFSSHLICFQLNSQKEIKSLKR